MPKIKSTLQSANSDKICYQYHNNTTKFTLLKPIFCYFSLLEGASPEEKLECKIWFYQLKISVIAIKKYGDFQFINYNPKRLDDFELL